MNYQILTDGELKIKLELASQYRKSNQSIGPWAATHIEELVAAYTNLKDQNKILKESIIDSLKETLKEVSGK